jgi:PAT family beta-lactamase induction signal transducer AmpG
MRQHGKDRPDGTVRLDEKTPFTGLQGWRLPDENKVIGFSTGLNPVAVEVIQFFVCGAIVVWAIFSFRRSIRGSELGEALTSFVKQSGFPAILFFVMFYRFGEVLVGKITPLFLKDPIDKGGLAISNEQLGFLSGGVGVVGIILGGILGGLTVSKFGLRRCFIPLALAMHVPNILYLLASMGSLPMSKSNMPLFGEVNLTLGGILFVDQFGYGFGFAAYMIYLMWVAQRGRFTTSHYAIGTGMGALFIAVAGVLSGILQKNFGYTGTYVAVLFMSIPGLLSLLFIPLDESHKQIRVEVE